jgi:hypothetical protein
MNTLTARKNHLNRQRWLGDHFSGPVVLAVSFISVKNVPPENRLAYQGVLISVGHP